jgi:hypothetical protein
MVYRLGAVAPLTVWAKVNAAIAASTASHDLFVFIVVSLSLVCAGRFAPAVAFFLLPPAHAHAV